MNKRTKQAAPAADEGVRIRMLATISGTEPQINPGDEIVVDAEEAKRLVAIGAAVLIDD